MAEQRWRHQHPSVDDVMKVLSKASRELLLVQRQLEQEFQRSYPENVNPCKIVVRIKKIQDDLVALKELCRELLAEKQRPLMGVRKLISPLETAGSGDSKLVFIPCISSQCEDGTGQQFDCKCCTSVATNPCFHTLQDCQAVCPKCDPKCQALPGIQP